ncbi:hypothetical protein F5X99DRAFT_414825 [Biscogniauxia marginata]|nr:hypothetical protein F5X99DRAFT_414825 [Biscogniauxia marginata]
METFALTSQHTGTINHVHSIHLDASAAAAARELRLAVTVIVVGWVAVTGLRAIMGSKEDAKSEFDKNIKIDKRDFAAIEFLVRKGRRQLEVYSAPGIKDIRARHQQKQRRISRKKYGVHVSRRLPAQGSRGSMGSGSRHSLMQVSEFTNHPYWGTLRQSRVAYPKPRTSGLGQGNPSHVKKNHVEKNAPYACDPQRFVSRPRSAQRTREKAYGRSQRREREKRYGIADPAAWDAINRALMQQRRLSSFIVADDLGEMPRRKSRVRSRTPAIPSRTSSERRALSHFTRELEKYANVAGVARKAPVITPTESESKVSYHTVKPLLPYRDEFEAAGLAVTSAEQRHQSPAKTNVRIPLRKSGLHANPNTSRKQGVELDGQYDLGREKRSRSESSSTSSASVVQFTPPDGFKTHLMEPLPPPPKAKWSTKSKACEKRRLFPWLKRKPPIKKKNGPPLEPQQGFQPVKYGSIQIYPKPSHSLDQNTHCDARTRKNSPIRNMQPVSNKRLPKPPRLPRDVISPKALPCTALSSVECKQRDQGPHPQTTVQRVGTAGERQTHDLHGKRDVRRAHPPLPRPETFIGTIEEEKDTLPSHFDHLAIPRSSQARSKGKPAPTNVTNLPLVAQSPQTQPSSIPSLPSTTKYAVSTPSSFERALDAVSQRFDNMEQQAGNPCSHPRNLAEKTNRPTRSASQQATDQKSTRTSRSHGSRPTDKAIHADRTMPPSKPAQADTKPLPPEPTYKASAALQTPAEDIPSNEKAKSEQARTEQMLKDFDVFLDYDDGDVNDRDVLKGLQVAVHAAADDGYDAYIMNKTGLRIRRFLADLKSVDEMQQDIASNRRARERRAESRRLQRVQDRQNLHRSGT